MKYCVGHSMKIRTLYTFGLNVEEVLNQTFQRWLKDNNGNPSEV